MQIKEMVDKVNQLTGQGIYSENDLLHYFDECIDEINEELMSHLPLISAVYKNEFDKIAGEEDDDYSLNDLTNNYTRIPDSYLRNYVCYEVSWKVLRDEDEDPEVYAGRMAQANSWKKRLVANFSNFKMQDTESILVNGDVDEAIGDSRDDTKMGYYNPYSINNGED